MASTQNTALRPIAPGDADFIAALEDVGMPTSDLESSGGIYFALSDERGEAIGYCGYETPIKGIAFIRSCVVPETGRGKGTGRAMMHALMERLAADGLSDFYLLTMDADPFFERFGFKIISRDDAPDAVQGTSQFALELCNGAVLMRRRSDAERDV
ncbi:MAG: GNAT family N-acetyltransferase [Pseudomonadota bacterium]